MYKIPANTLFLGKNLIYVPQCHSTNTVAAELNQKTTLPEGTVVITGNQFAGRGQSGNSWEAAPGENITMSVVLRPGFLAPREQFRINAAISLGVSDYFIARAGQDAQIMIKWPNDIYAQDHKLGGILIENHIQAGELKLSIAGVGLNINQSKFHHPKARSLANITKKTYDLNDELALLCGSLEVRYIELKQHRVKDLERRYLDILYRRDQIHRFRSGGQDWDGVIQGVDDAGRIRILIGDAERTFGVKELVFL